MCPPWSSEAERGPFFLRIIVHKTEKGRDGGKIGIGGTLSHVHIVDLLGPPDEKALSYCHKGREGGKGGGKEVCGDAGSCRCYTGWSEQERIARRVCSLDLMAIQKVVREMRSLTRATSSSSLSSALPPSLHHSRVTSARDSKLSSVLSPLLQGNTRVFFLAFLVDSPSSLSSSLNTLQFTAGVTEMTSACYKVHGVPLKALSLQQPDTVLSVFDIHPPSSQISSIPLPLPPPSKSTSIHPSQRSRSHSPDAKEDKVHRSASPTQYEHSKNIPPTTTTSIPPPSSSATSSFSSSSSTIESSSQHHTLHVPPSPSPPSSPSRAYPPSDKVARISSMFQELLQSLTDESKVGGGLSSISTSTHPFNNTNKDDQLHRSAGESVASRGPGGGGARERERGRQRQEGKKRSKERVRYSLSNEDDLDGRDADDIDEVHSVDSMDPIQDEGGGKSHSNSPVTQKLHSPNPRPWSSTAPWKPPSKSPTRADPPPPLPPTHSPSRSRSPSRERGGGASAASTSRSPSPSRQQIASDFKSLSQPHSQTRGGNGDNGTFAEDNNKNNNQQEGKEGEGEDDDKYEDEYNDEDEDDEDDVNRYNRITPTPYVSHPIASSINTSVQPTPEPVPPVPPVPITSSSTQQPSFQHTSHPPQLPAFLPPSYPTPPSLSMFTVPPPELPPLQPPLHQRSLHTHKMNMRFYYVIAN